jgi:hypothetical protein
MSSEGDTENVNDVNIWQALRRLPLCDELYLGMQAMNLAVVGNFLEHQEARLLSEYMETERTPLETTVFVSALSQMWVFALYELLRTWRQRVREVLRWAKDIQAAPAKERKGRLVAKRKEIEARAAAPREAAAFHWRAYKKAATDAVFVESLRKAFDRTERLFRRVEAFRVSLAKHEMPGMHGSYAMAPGYGRIDMTTGSIYWQVVLRGDEVDLVSRRTIADECRRLALGRDVLILPERLQDKVRKLPDDSYGVKRIVVVLDDGTTYGGVYVGWSKEVLWIEGHDTVPFNVARVVEVRHDPGRRRGRKSPRAVPKTSARRRGYGRADQDKAH